MAHRTITTVVNMRLAADVPGWRPSDPATQGRAFLMAIDLNSVFVGIKFIYGVHGNSTTLETTQSRC